MITRPARTLLIASGTIIPLIYPTIALADTDVEPGGLFSSGALVELALLLAALACASMAFKVYSSVRGGRIAQGWQWFMIGFVVLGVAQAAGFATEAGFFALSDTWLGLIRLGSIVIILIGAARMRRLLA